MGRAALQICVRAAKETSSSAGLADGKRAISPGKASTTSVTKQFSPSRSRRTVFSRTEVFPRKSAQGCAPRAIPHHAWQTQEHTRLRELRLQSAGVPSQDTDCLRSRWHRSQRSAASIRFVVTSNETFSSSLTSAVLPSDRVGAGSEARSVLGRVRHSGMM